MLPGEQKNIKRDDGSFAYFPWILLLVSCFCIDARHASVPEVRKKTAMYPFILLLIKHENYEVVSKYE